MAEPLFLFIDLPYFTRNNAVMGLSVAASAVYYDYVSCTGWQKILVLQIVSRTGAAV